MIYCCPTKAAMLLLRGVIMHYVSFTSLERDGHRIEELSQPKY